MPKNLFSSRTLRHALAATVLLVQAGLSFASNNAAKVNPNELKDQIEGSLIVALAQTQLLTESLVGTANAAKDSNLVVNDASIADVERLWQTDESKTIPRLEALIANMEKSASVEDPRNIPNIYWLHARAQYVHKNNCDAAFSSLYKASMTGFEKLWPSRNTAYRELSSALIACTSRDQRKELAKLARTELNNSAIEGNVSVDTASEEKLLADATQPSMNDAISKVQDAIPMLITATTFLAVIILIMALRNAATGETSGTPAASGTQAPTAGSSAPAKKAHETSRAAPRDRRPPKSGKQKGLQRLNPWK